MFKNWYRLGVSLTTLLALAFGPAAPSAMAAGGVVVLPNGGLWEVCQSAALDPLTGVIALTGSAGYNTLAASLLPSGDLNAAFRGGIVVTSVGGGRSGSNACAVQTDGKVLSGGSFTYSGRNGFALVRYNTNGTLDKTFNKTGMVQTKFTDNAFISAMVLQPDGKIVVTGTFATRVITARYTANGKLDSSFGSGGIVLAPAFPDSSSSGSSIALQGDKIIVGANAFHNPAHRMKLIRYFPNGALDVSFGDSGVASFFADGFYGTFLGDIVVDPLDGSIVATGWSNDNQLGQLTLARFNSDGGLDLSFGNGQGHQGFITFFPEVVDPSGPWWVSFRATSVALDDFGRIVIAGFREDLVGRTILVARFFDDGTPDTGDTGFNNRAGYAADVPGGATAVLVQPDGNIVAAGTITSGSTSSIVVVRYLPNGTPDPDF